MAGEYFYPKGQDFGIWATRQVNDTTAVPFEQHRQVLADNVKFEEENNKLKAQLALLRADNARLQNLVGPRQVPEEEVADFLDSVLCGVLDLVADLDQENSYEYIAHALMPDEFQDPYD